MIQQDVIRSRPAPIRQGQLIQLALLFALPWVTIIFGAILSNALIAHRCPVGTLISGSTAESRLPLSLFAACAGSAGLGCIPFLVRTARRRKLSGGGRDFDRLLRWAKGVAAGGVATVLLVAIAGSYAQFCVLPDRITFRPGPFAQTETYPWTAVQAVVPTCRHVTGRNSQDAVGYNVVMSSGRTIDIGYTHARLPAIVAAARAGLRDVPYAYDVSRVSKRCDPIHTSLLLVRPTGPR